MYVTIVNVQHVRQEAFVKKYSVTLTRERENMEEIPYIYVSKQEMKDDYGMQPHPACLGSSIDLETLHPRKYNCRCIHVCFSRLGKF